LKKWQKNYNSPLSNFITILPLDIVLRRSNLCEFLSSEQAGKKLLDCNIAGQTLHQQFGNEDFLETRGIQPQACDQIPTIISLSIHTNDQNDPNFSHYHHLPAPMRIPPPGATTLASGLGCTSTSGDGSTGFSEITTARVSSSVCVKGLQERVADLQRKMSKMVRKLNENHESGYESESLRWGHIPRSSAAETEYGVRWGIRRCCGKAGDETRPRIRGSFRWKNPLPGMRDSIEFQVWESDFGVGVFDGLSNYCNIESKGRGRGGGYRDSLFGFSDKRWTHRVGTRVTLYKYKYNGESLGLFLVELKRDSLLHQLPVR
jgi:hypothetical protein